MSPSEHSRQQQAYAVIEQQTPPWLLSAEARQVGRTQGLAAIPWYTRALADMPDVVARLQDDYREHSALATQVGQWLGSLDDPEAFAEPLLRSALHGAFGLDLDVRNTWLFHPRRMQHDDSFITASRDWAVENFKAYRLACRPLLSVALQNFEAWECEPGGMDLPVTKARIFSVTPGQALWEGQTLDIAPQRFAQVCRELDLGSLFQTHIAQAFDPRLPGADDPAARVRRQEAFKRHEQSGLLLHLHLARMRDRLDPALYRAAVRVLHNREASIDGVAVTCSCLSLWQVELNGILLFGADRSRRDGPDRIIVHIPDDPVEPLRQYESFLDFASHLRDRLLQPDYQQFFQRFIPLRHRASVLEKLRQAFHPKVWNPGGWYEESLDPQAWLPFRETTLDGLLMPTLLRRRIAALKADGLYLVVPTAVENHKSLEDKLRYFADAGLTALNALAFAVPVVGAAMMLFSTVQLVHEVYEGIGEWSRDEREQAWAYLFDVLENVALVAALAGSGAPRPGTAARELPVLPEGLHPVRLADGGTRLWNRDLKPFAHDIILPADLLPNARGLYEYQGKQWLALGGQHYSVLFRQDGTSFIEHPSRVDACQPALFQHPGGGWLHEVDQPQQWSGLALFERLGPAARRLDATRAGESLLISGCHESELRRALMDGQPAPALLTETLERQRIHREVEESGEAQERNTFSRLFDRRYQASFAPANPAQSVILRDFGGLPRRLVDELLAHASHAELTLIEAQQRVPPRLADEARFHLQNVRLARAYEGLFLPVLENNDCTRLVLHSLAGLPGWPEEFRLEIRALRDNGPLLDGIGPSPAVHRRVLVKTAEGYRTAEEPEVAAADLFAVVLRTLTSVQRQALGLTASDTASALRARVLQRPLQRPALRKVLQMQPIRPGMRSPMRLANGRPGYPLSGHPQLPAVVSENTLLDRIRLLELPDIFAHDLLQQLRGIGLDDAVIDARLVALLEEREQMRQLLPAGEAPHQAGDSEPALSDRQLIELALWQHWRDNLLPEIGRSNVPLRLFAVSLESFPEQLPAFFRDRVQALELSRVAVPPAIMTPGADGVLRFEDRLQQLLRGFPRVTRLEIDGGEGRSLYDLPRTIVGAYPRLSELRLLNLHLPLGQELLDELCRLGELRHLDLSGNRPSHLPVHLSNGPQLEFLGLDRLGLEDWPEWLDRDLLDGIERISLRDNRLTGLPPHLRDNPPQAARSTWISLRGNLFSLQTLIAIRSSAWSGRRFHFDLHYPQSVENIVANRMFEREQLSTAIERWLDISRRDATLEGTRIIARRSFGDALLADWSAQAEGSVLRSLALEDVRLDDFPDPLPAFYLERINRLELVRPLGGAQPLDALLRRFPNLQHLVIGGVALDGLPEALGDLAQLHHLALTDAGLQVDQALLDRLARLPGLTSLELSGNRLGEVSDVSGFARLSFSLLALERMDISRWPAWLDSLLPERVQWLNLNNNRLGSLPAYLLENRETASGSTEISLEGNPLSEETMHSAHLSEGLTRPYTFRMDLPEHIRRLDGSWRGSSSGGGSSGGTSQMDLISVDVWLDRADANSDVRRQLWRQLETGDDAEDLLHLVGRLRHTAEYRNTTTRPDLIERVWQVLTICAQDTELRLTLNGMAEEPLRQLREYDTCPDGIRLEFNQMEILVYTALALRSVSAAQRGPALYRLMRRLYRLHELDGIARSEAGSRDEAEVRLAYRLNLANQLDLPLAPEQMLYSGSANLHPGELERVAARVRQGESGQGLLDYAAQRDFWLGYLQEVYAARFTAIREDFEDHVLTLDDLYPDDTPVQTSARIQQLIDQRKLDEAALVGELTHREGLEAGPV
ncbi:NEL-type E3 ubiquitin ligase domain-containing protein [Pseudomonas putida]|uniref:RING-type E3 ubiquitin transferase n=1 Tax=Pseudomonas putida TaxID=303 RepID=A0A1Q9QUT1_PSEPU|nr:DUF6543 domain-containing protein [Pseudomonas putida]OLS58904.1 hypothetical protein PSEMO_62650 [Pseudomonas putida]